MPVNSFSNKSAACVRRTTAKFFSFGCFLMGLVIGVACITPGLSAGVIAAATGLYEPALHALTHLHRAFKKGVLFLLPLGLGVLAGALLFGNVMKWLMVLAPTTVLYVFLGLVAGSLPALVREANRDGFRPRYLIGTAAAFAAVLLVEVLLGRVLPPAGLALDIPGCLLCGLVIAVGTLIPGISSSFLLLQLGVYGKLLGAATGFYIPVLAFVGLGFGAAALALVFAADRLFKRFRGAAYCAVLGFLAGSVVTVFPGFAGGWHLALDLALFFACGVGCWLVMRMAPGKRAPAGAGPKNDTTAFGNGAE